MSPAFVDDVALGIVAPASSTRQTDLYAVARAGFVVSILAATRVAETRFSAGLPGRGTGTGTGTGTGFFGEGVGEGGTCPGGHVQGAVAPAHTVAGEKPPPPTPPPPYPGDGPRHLPNRHVR